MKNKRVIIGSLATFVAAGTLGVSVANAYFGGSATRREAVRSAIERNDFAAFQSAIGDSSYQHAINTEAEFNAIVHAHELREQGDYKAARAVLENAGIEVAEFTKFGRKNSAKAAIRSGDWNAFKEATQGKEMGKNIRTQDDFYKLTEAHQLHKEGRHDEARELMRELGLHEKNSVGKKK